VEGMEDMDGMVGTVAGEELVVMAQQAGKGRAGSQQTTTRRTLRKRRTTTPPHVHKGGPQQFANDPVPLRDRSPSNGRRVATGLAQARHTIDQEPEAVVGQAVGVQEGAW
jgi:hypothetical protein